MELLNKAVATYAVADMLDRHERIALAKELAEFGALSKKQIASITHLDPQELTRAFEKKDYKGGKLNPDTLEAIRELAGMPDTEARWRSILDIYQRGTSPDVMALFLGESRDALWNRIRKVRKMGGE